MAYFHIDRTRAYVDSLGLSEAAARQAAEGARERDPGRQLLLLVDDPVDDARHGGVDDGEDADVIVHEYGHSLQDQAVKGAFGRTIATGSMGEGFGDYLAAAMSALVTGGNPGFDACIFDWDSISYSPTGCGRRADRAPDPEAGPAPCLLEIHCVGEAWSGAAVRAPRGARGRHPGPVGDGQGRARVALHARQALELPRRRTRPDRRGRAALRRRSRPGDRGGADRAPILQAVRLLTRGRPLPKEVAR